MRDQGLLAAPETSGDEQLFDPDEEGSEPEDSVAHPAPVAAPDSSIDLVARHAERQSLAARDNAELLTGEPLACLSHTLLL